MADALARADPAPPEQRVAVARPGLIFRVMFAAVLVMALLFLAALLVLGSRVAVLVREVRLEREHRLTVQDHAPPPEAVLRDPEALRRELATRPRAAGAIWLARLRVLAADGAWPEIEATCARIAASAPGDLLPAAQLIRVEALARLGRMADAGRVLHAIDPQQLDEAGRQGAAALAGQLWLAGSVERAAEKPGQPAPE